ncbi:toll/interleukin-1 receptor domain-containing protein [Myceligenerans salitolerans]|uniref:Toll/interleukin-1 receptor domain-containing protein n=1 Tax=Myceligenerans salitolerans TaxID=1230528 RepID=A0ABS3IAA5_9MICO|nr:toll/interleukin-1 receptor domain-containing protein [Myceligenerans salitolerans]MBO0609893.1 toll/interleukin-1 receptor domain-containing protein [Myceligenerans salitolerans]
MEDGSVEMASAGVPPLDTSQVPRGERVTRVLVDAIAAGDDRLERHYLEIKGTIDLTGARDRAKLAESPTENFKDEPLGKFMPVRRVRGTRTVRVQAKVRVSQRRVPAPPTPAQRRAITQVDQGVKKLESASRALEAAARRARPRVTYTPSEQMSLAPIALQAEQQASRHPDRRDVFLCHAWDDREGVAKTLHDLLESFDVAVWFSEKDVALGTSLIREIDRGLKMSHIGVVLVTPNMLNRLDSQGIADKELSALLATDRVIPVVDGTSFEALRDESPLLASRSGLSTEENTLEQIAIKIADAVRPRI